MKTLLVWLLWLAPAFLHSAPIPREAKVGIFINTEFNYQNGDKKLSLKKGLVLDKENRTWTPLVTPKDGVTVLGRLVEESGQSITMEYIILDTAKDETVFSSPKIIARLGERAEMSIATTKGKATVALTADRTVYSPDEELKTTTD